MMVEALSHRLPSDSKVILAPLAFAQNIFNFVRGKGETRLLKRYVNGVTEGKIQQIYFPVHVHNQHWIAAYLDFEKKCFGVGEFFLLFVLCMYLLLRRILGDSLSHFFGSPKLFLADLKKWIKRKFSGPFTYDCERFPHGAQQDSYNCGIFTVNAIGHAVIGDPILMAAEANKERLKWFALFGKTVMSGGDRGEPIRPNLTNLLNPLDDFTMDVSPYEEAFELVDEAVDILSDTPVDDSDSDVEIILDDNDPPATILPSTTHSSAPGPEDHDAGLVESEPEIPHEQVMPIDHVQCDPPIGKDSDANVVKPKLKRTSHFSSDDNDEYETDNDNCRPMKKRGKGKSRSAISSLKVREALRKGMFEVDDQRLKAWKVQITQDDHGATFDPSNIRRVRHSICGSWIKVKQPFDRTRWKSHLKNCVAKKKKHHEKPSANMATLKSMGFFVPKKAATKQEPPQPKVMAVEYPCPGLSDVDDGRISKYLSRTQVLQAGSVSLQKIVEEIYGTDSEMRFVDLEEAERKRVVDEHEHRQTWRNVHERKKVYAIDCQKVVSKHLDDERALPCSKCVAVFRSKKFKNALQRDAPDEKNAIYVPNKFRNSQIAKIYARCRGLQGIVEKEVSHHPYLAQ